MRSSANNQRILEAQGPQSLTGSGSAKASIFTRAMTLFEKYLLVLVIGGLLGGIGVASVSQPVVDRVDSTINGFMGVYDFVAPIAIFLILAPSLARLFATRSLGKFGALVIGWFAVRKLLAGLWAIGFVFVVFRLPVVPQGSVSLMDGITQTLGSLADMATTSTYFWAMYAAVAVSLISTRVEKMTVFLEKIIDLPTENWSRCNVSNLGRRKGEKCQGKGIHQSRSSTSCVRPR